MSAGIAYVSALPTVVTANVVAVDARVSRDIRSSSSARFRCTGVSRRDNTHMFVLGDSSVNDGYLESNGIIAQGAALKLARNIGLLVMERER